MDSNKQYVSELLAILMQRSGANQKRLAETGGIDTVLRAIARYKNRSVSILLCSATVHRLPFARSLSPSCTCTPRSSAAIAKSDVHVRQGSQGVG